MNDLLQMLSYMRPAQSRYEQKFVNRYIRPVFGDPDIDGNFVRSVGGNPNRIAFMAHYDTVHNQSGRQKLHISSKGIVTAKNQNCLGADCTTGVWLILEMIAAKVPGLYVIHAEEKSGCIGSMNLVRSEPDWLTTLDAAISFDRKGTESIITHQMGMRTASDSFAYSLADALDLPMMPDDTGSYTDSNEYAYRVPECTNISVGYDLQHTSKEFQDLHFAHKLRDRLLTADFSMLSIKRDPDAFEFSDPPSPLRSRSHSYMADLILDHPERTAELLRQLGFDATDLIEEFGIHPREYVM